MNPSKAPNELKKNNSLSPKLIMAPLDKIWQSCVVYEHQLVEYRRKPTLFNLKFWIADQILLRKKDRKFSSMVESRYGTTVSAPIIAGNVFAFVLTMDIKINGRDREKMTELCVYHVKDGKIISEQFFM